MEPVDHGPRTEATDPEEFSLRTWSVGESGRGRYTMGNGRTTSIGTCLRFSPGHRLTEWTWPTGG